MLHIEITSEVSDRYIHNVDNWFDSTYEPWWITTDFARMAIRDIDKSEVIAPRIIDSPYLGYVDPTHLSGGVKCILCLMFNDRRNMDITVCGDNCAKWIQVIGSIKDITVKLDYFMEFKDDAPFNIHILNNDSHSHNYREFMDNYIEVR